jgi:uncharacterized protein (TIGR02996 family)
MFTEAEQNALRAVLAQPDDFSRRLVLADMLLERGHPLGELIHLECSPGPLDLARVVALRRELEPVVRGELYPWACSVGFDGGLPFCVEVDRARLSSPVPQREPCELPLRWVRIAGEPGFVFHLLSLPVCEQVECVDLFRAEFDTACTQFLGDAPPPVPRLRALRHLLAPDEAPPAHWKPLVSETFADVQVLSVRAQHDALGEWLALTPSARCIDLRGSGPWIPRGLRQEATQFVKAVPGRELRFNGVRVAPEHLDEALREPSRPQVSLSEVAQPPFDTAEAVEVHEFLDAGAHLAEATLGNDRGLWLRLEGSRAFIDHLRLVQSVRLAMMAPLHANVVAPRRAVRHGHDMWLRLPEGLRVFEPASEPRGVLRDVLAVGRALESLGPYLVKHASPALRALPIPRWGLLRASDGTVRMLVPPDGPFLPDDDPLAWGPPTEFLPRDVSRGLAALLLHWLTGRPWAVLAASGGVYGFGDWVALERAKRASLPPGLPAPLVPVLERALSVEFETQLTLGDFLAALAPLAS